MTIALHSNSAQPGAASGAAPPESAAEAQPQIRIGKNLVPAEMAGRPITIEIFTMTLGDETIQLLPLKTWSQLDVFKWRVRGKLPGTPAGLEIAADHVKLAGETVPTYAADGCERLERLFNEWLALERAALEEAKQKAQAAPSTESTVPQEDEPLRFRVVTDKTGQPHIVCLEGSDTVANVAVTVPGLISLFNQGLIRKPAAWKIGPLRDWLELDGQLFRFQHAGSLSELERFLNKRCLQEVDPSSAGDVRVYENPASTTGFDIQFPAIDNGLAENKRRHLDTGAMELMSDPRRCRVLRKGIVVKLTPPNFIFKEKTVDGGERELTPGRENIVALAGDNGQTKEIDLSQPVSHIGLTAMDLDAIFNHPAINRRARAKQTPPAA